jgi:short subunit dehydrogenase-like uncharacterized protein
VDPSDGERAVSRLVSPQLYRLPTLTAVTAAARVVDGDAPLGFQTPAAAFGSDFVLAVGSVERSDDPIVGGDRCDDPTEEPAVP